MLIAHAPIGFILARYSYQGLAAHQVSWRHWWLCCVLGALAPDIDMLYFHLVDGRQHNHHSYFTHFPSVWLPLTLAALLWRRARPISTPALLTAAFLANTSFHLVLDSIVGDIRWLAPYSDKAFSLFHVPTLHSIWWLNYVLHPSFTSEIMTSIWAVRLALKTPLLRKPSCS